VHPTPPTGWSTDSLLADGAIVRIRPVLPSDETALSSLLADSTDDSTPLADLTAVDYHREMAFVAFLDEELVALGRYSWAGTPEVPAELRFYVRGDQRHRGIGTILLEDLVSFAHRQGVVRFVAEMHADNTAMINVFTDSGYQVEETRGSNRVHVAFSAESSEKATDAIEHREQVAERRSLQRVLSPQAVAVVGAGRDPGGVGHAIFRNLLRCGFEGPVFPINPKARSIAGVRAYPSLSAVPDPVDLVVVAVPPNAVLDVIRESASVGVAGLLVVTAGFAETGQSGLEVEQEAVDLARRHGMRLIGPNCIGIVNTDPAVRLNATFADTDPVEGHVGLLSQSGAVGVVALEHAVRSGLGLSTFVSVGNKADVSGNDLLAYWEDDEHTDVILLYLESFGNPRKFAQIARRVSHQKPIVAVKSGRTPAGTNAARSHTAAAATSDTAVDALFQHTGVIRVDTIQELFDTGALLACQPAPRGRRVVIVGNSGGPGILAADACAGAGLEVVSLPESTQKALADIAPLGAAVGNPVDLTAGAQPSHYRDALALLKREPEVDSLLVVFTPLPTTPNAEVLREIGDAGSSGDKTVVAVILTGQEEHPLLGSRGDTPETPGLHPSRRVVQRFSTPEPAVRALARAAWWSQWRAQPIHDPAPAPSADRAAVRCLIDAFLDKFPEGGWLSNAAALELAAAYEIRTVESAEVANLDAALRAAESIGYPVVLKAGAGNLVHKTDVGGVALGLADPEALRSAYSTMQSRLGTQMQPALLQATALPGVEVIVGAVSDPQFGPLLMFGMGGTITDLLGDHAVRLLPLTEHDADECIHSLRSLPLLTGYRGSTPVDMGALRDVVLRFAALAGENEEIQELDANPVILRPDGALAVDVKVRLAPHSLRPEATLRRLR
jgi:acetyl coenzyme A synthetase (ADP forming)-like protein